MLTEGRRTYQKAMERSSGLHWHEFQARRSSAVQISCFQPGKMYLHAWCVILDLDRVMQGSRRRDAEGVTLKHSF